jgi:hypothetical protein
MSLTKRFAEQQEEEDNRNQALQALLDCDLLEGAAAGIAKKVIGENSLDGLSAKQKGVYQTVICPKFEICCDNTDCEQRISMDMVADAIRNEAAGEDVNCVDCQYTFRDRGD